MILAGILIPTLLFAKLDNIYIILLLITTVWMGLIGFIDDCIKVFKKNKNGLRGQFKIAGQVILGLMVGLILYYNPDVTIKEKAQNEFQIESLLETPQNQNIPAYGEAEKSTKTTIPFLKNNELC